MARYIDADKLIEKIFPIGLINDGNYTINAKAIKMAVDMMPTSDVVPKSEVDKAEAEIERLQTILESYALQYGTVRDQHKVKSEIAREIFWEIKTCLEYEYMSYLKAYDYTLLTRIEELENKYTEGE